VPPGEPPPPFLLAWLFLSTLLTRAAHASQVFDEEALRALMEGSTRTRPQHIDRQYLRRHRQKLAGPRSRQWYLHFRTSTCAGTGSITLTLPYQYLRRHRQELAGRACLSGIYTCTYASWRARARVSGIYTDTRNLAGLRSRQWYLHSQAVVSVMLRAVSGIICRRPAGAAHASFGFSCHANATRNVSCNRERNPTP
jgi:hypothetical protein